MLRVDQTSMIFVATNLIALDEAKNTVMLNIIFFIRKIISSESAWPPLFRLFPEHVSTCKLKIRKWGYSVYSFSHSSPAIRKQSNKSCLMYARTFNHLAMCVQVNMHVKEIPLYQNYEIVSQKMHLFSKTLIFLEQQIFNSLIWHQNIHCRFIN